MSTQIEQEIENKIEMFLLEAYGLVVTEYRTELEDAIEYFGKNGIKDGYGVVDWLLFRKGIIESCRSLASQVSSDDEQDALFEMVASSFCSVFESDGEQIRDIFTGEEYPVALPDQGLVCGRLYGNQYLLEYDIIPHIDGSQVITLVQKKDDQLLAMRQVVRAADFEPEENMYVIERIFRYNKSPIHTLTEMGLDLYADDVGTTFEVYLGDRCLGEIEVEESKNQLISYTNNRKLAGELDQYLYEIAQFQEETIRGIEDYLDLQ